MKCKYNNTQYECIDGKLFYVEYDCSLSAIYPFYTEYIRDCKCSKVKNEEKSEEE